MTETLTLHRCKRCGYLLDSSRKKYHEECALAVDKILSKRRQKRYRDRHGNSHVEQWCKEHPEQRKQHIRTFQKKHAKELADYNRNYRALHPKWYREQLDKNNKKLKELRHTPGHCPKCGREANKSSYLGLCTNCLFKRSDTKYRKRTNQINIENELVKKDLLRVQYQHLIPDQVYEPWVDEFIRILGLKVHLGIIEKTGERNPWPSKEVQRLWNRYEYQLKQYQLIHSI